jgi:DNA-nicking Smr family endonuclease
VSAEDEPGEWPDVVEVPVEAELDLHSFAPREIPDVVGSYLEACLEKGLSEVRLIHGRGRGVQRAVVRRLLSRHPHVRSFEDASPASGGWGATLVRLRAGRQPRPTSA